MKRTQEFFAKKGIDTPRLDAEVLLSEVLSCERIYLYVNFDKPLEKDELDRYREFVMKRAQRYCVAHIVGKKEFMGLSFKVTADTLVPRPDTEILAGVAAERLKKKPGEKTFADIGTGTGAVGLSVCRFAPNTAATLTDISEAALAVAEENAAALGLAERCEFLVGDLTAPIAGKKFTAILSNPPYIPEKDLATLPPEVKREPKSALAGGTDGLDFYRRLAKDAPPLIETGGFVAVEVGAGQALSVAEIFARNSFADTETVKDLAGIERVVIAWKRE